MQTIVRAAAAVLTVAATGYMLQAASPVAELPSLVRPTHLPLR